MVRNEESNRRIHDYMVATLTGLSSLQHVYSKLDYRETAITCMRQAVEMELEYLSFTRESN